MKIAIIGTGNIGGALTRRLTQLGHEVTVANSRGPESLRDLAAETGAIPCTVREVVRGAEIIVVTIPEKNIPSLPADLFAQAPEDTVVIDTGNYYPRQGDGKITEIEDGVPESRWVEQLEFDAVDAGGLDESWRQQPGTLCYGADFDAEGLREALRAASPNRTADWRA